MTKPVSAEDMQHMHDEDEIDLKQLFHTLLDHKSTIFWTTLLTTALAWTYLYFKPVTYESYAIVDIKTQKNQAVVPDMGALFEGMSGLSNDDVAKQMALYKTFSVNEKVLKEVPIDVQYFKEENLKQVELYKSNPVEVSDAIIINDVLMQKKIMIYPQNGTQFQLKVFERTFVYKAVSFLAHFHDYFSEYAKPDFEGIYDYDKMIQTEDFKFKVKKMADFSEPIIIKFNGSKREIYENVIKKNLTVAKVEEKSSLIKLSYRDNVSQRAEAYVDTLAQTFSALNVTEKSEKNKNVIAAIDAQLADISGRMSKAENTIEAYKVSENIVKPQQQSTSLIEKLSKIDFDLTQAELKYNLIIQLSRTRNFANNIDSISLSLSELGDQQLETLFDALQLAQLKRNELRIDFKDSFPEIRKLDSKIDSIQNKIRSSIGLLKRTLANKIDGLKTAKSKSEELLKTLPEKERKLVNFNRNYEVNSRMYTYLLKLKAEKTIAQSGVLSDFKVVDTAYTDRSSAKPKNALVLMVAGITGLILGVFLALLRSFFDDRIKDMHSIEHETNLPIFGFVPQLKKNIVKLEVLENKNSSFSESFREIRNNIRSAYGDNESNIVLVTSTVSGEGKTVTSVNLASIMSMVDYKCIIINMDLRKPTMHKYFSISNQKGLSSYLSQRVTLDEVIHKTKYENLDVISAGPAVANPSELLLKQELEDMLAYLRVHYDYIIIDSAPIGLVADSLDLLKIADLTLFVLRDGVSKKGYLKNLNRVIRISNLSNVSLVINGMDSGNSGYGYGYGYGYGTYGDAVKKVKS